MLLALPRSDSRAPHAPQYVTGTGPPGPPQHDDFKTAAQPVTGAAPWALSALPECFKQLSSASGPAAFVRAKLPRRALQLPAGATLRVADCSVVVGRASALVTRGENRLIVPAVARFYLAEGHLVLDRQVRPARNDLRIYALRGAFTLSCAPAGSKPCFARSHSGE